MYKSSGTAVAPSTGTGLIAVRISSPGITSVSQAAAAWRAFCATPASATIIATPTIRAPTVSAVLPRSRVSAPRASRSSGTSNTLNGTPASLPSGPSTNGDAIVHARRRPYTSSARTSAGSPTRDGQARRPATAMAANTTASQRRRARMAGPCSGRERRASIGEIRPARQAGSSAAATVTSTPMAIARTTAASGTSTASTGTPATERT